MAEAGFTLIRVFDAPRERVWREWTEPERFADWFGGPDWQVPLSTVVMDVREGGRFRLTMRFGGREIHWKGDGRTEMLFEQRGHLTPEQYRYTREGWSGFFDRIAEVTASGRSGR